MSYDMDVIGQTETHRLRLVQDTDCPNPREDFDHFCGVLTIPGSRYADIAAPGYLVDDDVRRLFRRYGRFGYDAGKYDDDVAVRIFERWIRLHGGVTLYDSPPEGPAAVWYVTPAMAEPAGTPTDRLPELLQGERDEYRAWAEGDCWGYVLEEKRLWAGLNEGRHHDRMETWDEVESCWGFIGREYAIESAREVAPAGMEVSA